MSGEMALRGRAGWRWAPLLIPLGLIVVLLLVVAGLRACDQNAVTDERRLDALERTVIAWEAPAPMTIASLNPQVGADAVQNRTSSSLLITFDKHGLSQPEAASRLARSLVSDGWTVARAECADGRLEIGAGKDFGEFYGSARVTSSDDDKIAVRLKAPPAHAPPYPAWWTGSIPPASLPMPASCEA